MTQSKDTGRLSFPRVTTVSAKGALDQSLTAKWTATPVLTSTCMNVPSKAFGFS